MPFDWVRISCEGIIHTLRTDFAEFARMDFMSDAVQTHLAKTHKFFHDKLDDPRDVAKYHRRFERFRQLRNASESESCFGSLLFVRALDTTLELTRAKELYDTLADFFDSSVYLLLIVDCQHSDHIILFDDMPRLLVHLLSQSHAHPHEYEIDRAPFVTAYRLPLLASLWHVRCGWQPHNMVRLPSVAMLLSKQTGLLKHVSLGEELERYNYGIPQMPSDRVLRWAMCLESCATRHCVEGAVCSRLEWEHITRSPPERSHAAHDFLQWMR